jgi:hypothetical protein
MSVPVQTLPLTRALGSFYNFVVNGAVSERVSRPRAMMAASISTSL